MTHGPRISAIVCTYNRAARLGECLESLLSQTLDADEFEIIVVDNNSTDNTPDLLAELSAKHAHLFAIREPKQGLSAARNTGLRCAHSPFAAFLDDDAKARNDWLERFADRFDELEADVAMVGGDIDPLWGAARPDWLDQNMARAISAGLNWAAEAQFVDGKIEWLFEGASAYRIAPLLELGGFPENLGRIGDLLLSGEAALHYRLASQNLRFFYDPAIRMFHHISADRLNKAWFRRRYFWQGVTAFRLDDYLRENDDLQTRSARIELPVSEAAWLSAFDDEPETDFNHALATVYNLGYLLSAQNVVLGK